MIAVQAFGGGNCSGAVEISTALTAHGTRQDFDSETFIAHSLRGEGFDASEDGTGRSTPLVPIYTPEVAATMVARSSRGGGQTNSPGHQADREPIAFSAKDHGADAMEDCSPTLRAGGHANSHANAGVMPAIAFNMHKSGNEASSLGISEDKTDCLRAFDKSPFAVQPSPAMQVRRLTPKECLRLQGFPDDYLEVTHRGKPAADGPKYKAIGNSWAIPPVRWIGQRIEQVEAIANIAEAA